MTAMPEVIYAHEEKNVRTWYAHVEDGTKYIRTDKHEELKAIADKMDKVLDYCFLKLANSDYDSTVLKPILFIREEYNKYRGIRNEVHGF